MSYKVKIALIIGVMNVCILFLSFNVYGSSLFTKEISTTASIGASTPDLAFFADAACTTPITKVEFTSVVSGQSVSKDIYLKNAGSRDFIAISAVSNLDPALGNISAVVPAIPKGASAKATLTLSTMIQDVPVNPSFKTTFNATY